jgi:hypothetical protein
MEETKKYIQNFGRKTKKKTGNITLVLGKHHEDEQNIMVECLAFLLCIQGVYVSNLSLETGYPDKFFMVFISPSRQMLE